MKNFSTSAISLKGLFQVLIVFGFLATDFDPVQ